MLEHLDPASRAAAIAGFTDDLVTVCAHVVRNKRDYPDTHTMAALVAAMERRECPALPVLTTVVAWVCFTMRWNGKSRELTDDEIAIRDAAWRISDAIHGPRHH